MAEIQKHGFDFEEWVKKTFFEQFHQTAYTDKWDATNVVFKQKYLEHTINFLGLPVSIKTCQYGTPIYFGDAIRQFENSQDFLLIVGFWKAGGTGKKFVAAKGVKIGALEWHRLFDKAITPHELKKDILGASGVAEKIYNLESTIKNTFHYQVARKLAKEEKKKLPTMDITLNQKIDSKHQRRLQCSLPFQTFWTTFAKEIPTINQDCTLWEEKVPDLF